MTAPETQGPTVTLLPCPLCGGKAEFWRAHPENPRRKAWVACLNGCLVMTKEHDTTEAAIAAWNTRHCEAAEAASRERAEKWAKIAKDAVDRGLGIERELAASRVREAELREALTPSGDTKAAYMGEFSFSLHRIDEFGDEYPEKVYVPWTTIKEIMAAISARAALAHRSQSEKGEG